MAEQLSVLALPFVACLILTGIHAYLGIHVLSRKVIFVDIALAQIAALGATVAFLLGYDPRSEGAYYFSLVFAVLAAAIFALTRTRVERVPQEAIIGLTYAVASATAILLADISPHGAEHLKDLLAGSIVWVTPHQVIKTGILYSLIGAFHFIFRKRFLLISLDPEAAFASGLRVRLWDFLFYLSFGVVITSSVQIAGVLLVFCYLVAPAVFAVMFSDSLRMRLALGWTAGAVVSAVGLLFSYDRPSGPTIMVCFALALILGGVVRSVMTSPSRMKALATASAAAAVIAVGAFGLSRMDRRPGGHAADADDEHTHGGESTHAMEAREEERQSHPIGTSPEDLRLALADPHPGVRAKAVEGLEALGDRAAVPDLIRALEDASTSVRENAARALGRLGEPAAARPLLIVMGRPDEDEWVRLRAAESACLLGQTDALKGLLAIARSGDARLARLAALESVLAASGLPKPKGPITDAQAAENLERLDRWWQQHQGSLRWDAASRTYLPHAEP